MLATLVFGILAGAGTVYAEPKVKELLDGILLSDEDPLDATELRMFTFAVLLVLAAALAMIFSKAHAMPLALGAAIGVFGPRLIARYKGSKNPDYDS